MADKYVEWLKDALSRKPHLSQSGLAKHLGKHRSSVTQILNGEREIRVSELTQIESYLGERLGATESQRVPTLVEIVGAIGAAWYEPGARPATASRPVAPIPDMPGLRQVAYRAESDFPDLGVLAGDVIIATPVDKSRPPQAGRVVICRRERAGLENLTLARIDEDGGIVHFAGGNDAGQPVAIAIEIRSRL